MLTLNEINGQIATLEAKRKKITSTEKKRALKNVRDALKVLNSLGYNYKLAEGSEAPASHPSTPSKRRSGIRNKVLSTIKKKGPISRQDLFKAMGAKGDKAFENSISNAVNNLKNDKQITSPSGGMYKGV